eukprot:7379009-Prymnesium_polylepis.1
MPRGSPRTTLPASPPWQNAPSPRGCALVCRAPAAEPSLLLFGGSSGWSELGATEFYDDTYRRVPPRLSGGVWSAFGQPPTPTSGSPCVTRCAGRVSAGCRSRRPSTRSTPRSSPPRRLRPVAHWRRRKPAGHRLTKLACRPPRLRRPRQRRSNWTRLSQPPSGQSSTRQAAPTEAVRQHAVAPSFADLKVRRVCARVAWEPKGGCAAFAGARTPDTVRSMLAAEGERAPPSGG